MAEAQAAVRKSVGLPPGYYREGPLQGRLEEDLTTSIS